ncbi:MAG TPA: type II toxin-antitoxin system prevent-host-death family antitoxin [Verrucomicrobiae bacterium]
MKKEIPLYRQRKPALKMRAESSGPMVMREVATMPSIGQIISVRAAKAHLSALLELVAGGREITITSDGEPKAVLSPVGKHKARKIFTGTWEHLKKMPVQTEGPFADEIIRADRDGRGW